MARVSLRARLALITLAVVAAALIGANVAVNEYISSSLLDRRDEQLDQVARFARAVLTLPEGTLTQGPTSGSTPGATPDASGRNDRNSELPLDLAGAYTEVRDSEGRVVKSEFIFGGDRQRPQLPEQLVAEGDSRYIDIRRPRTAPTIELSRSRFPKVGSPWSRRCRSPISTTPRPSSS